MKIWNEVFWKPMPDGCAEAMKARPWTWRERVCLLGPVIALAACTVSIGFGADAVFALAERTAHQLLDPSEYLTAVLSGGGARP